MIRNRLAKAAALSVGAVVVALGIAGPAFAHVTVNPNSATQGGYGRVAFRVPNESDTASTTKLEVNLPEDAPVASVSTMPVPGWTVAVEKRTLSTPLEVHGSQVTEVVGKITWTASAGSEIKPGTFQEFPVSMGPLPEKDQMIFKALQTYSDGEVVRWIDEPVEGGEEPESPAPVLKLAKAADAAAGPTTGPTVSAVAASDSWSSSGAAVGLGIAGLVAGVLGLVLGGMAFIRTRRTSA
ncbi:YcnI family protein [Asanoa sp. WMMD1127]|uniref:YcnI family copper-binding membrane protein n=1 Tax=Asanoa sp. WMMD1127 TaxID=3016107 RepID=UPI002417C8B0|nr:YcnI family protein [Asanoa sp. WMMD1127]MDG4820559.1 YcnI family protein [Asanoa sp. WMMD1127]